MASGACLLVPAAVPVAAQRERVRRIAFLTPFPRADFEPIVASIKTELARLGWSDGLAFLELKTSEGRTDRLAALASEVVAQAPDLVAVQSAPATRALMRATTTIPIVMVAVGDPVAYGIVQSYATPGGNVTGTSFLVNESSVKTLELLKQVAPRIRSVAIFVNPSNEGAAPFRLAVAQVSERLGLRVHAAEVREAADFEPALAAIRREQVESLLLGAEALQRSQRFAIGKFASEHRLPMAVVGGTRFLDAGGLIAYGPGSAQYAALTARYIDRILRGADPATLPVEQPTGFDLAVNVTVAKALGLDIPASLLARAEVLR